MTENKNTTPHPDTIRLNWLEYMARNGGIFLYNGVDVAREKQSAVGLGLRPGIANRTLREAIDQAAPSNWNVSMLAAPDFDGAAAVDEAMVERACRAAWPEFMSAMEVSEWDGASPARKERLRIIVRSALTAALVGQQQGGVR